MGLRFLGKICRSVSRFNLKSAVAKKVCDEVEFISFGYDFVKFIYNFGFPSDIICFGNIEADHS